MSRPGSFREREKSIVSFVQEPTPQATAARPPSDDESSKDLGDKSDSKGSYIWQQILARRRRSTMSPGSANLLSPAGEQSDNTASDLSDFEESCRADINDMFTSTATEQKQTEADRAAMERMDEWKAKLQQNPSMKMYYQDMKAQYESALTQGVVLKTKELKEIQATPLHHQGNERYYEEAAIQKRYQLRNHPSLGQLIEQIWRTVPKVKRKVNDATRDKLQSESPGDQPLSADERLEERVNYNVFRAFTSRVFHRLVPAGKQVEFEQLVASDFAVACGMDVNSNEDAVKDLYLPLEGFRDSLIDVVDTWTNGMDLMTYMTFAEDVLLHQAKKIRKMDPYEWFDLREVFQRGYARQQRRRASLRRMSASGMRRGSVSPGAPNLESSRRGSRADLSDVSPSGSRRGSTRSTPAQGALSPKTVGSPKGKALTPRLESLSQPRRPSREVSREASDQDLARYGIHTHGGDMSGNDASLIVKQANVSGRNSPVSPVSGEVLVSQSTTPTSLTPRNVKGHGSHRGSGRNSFGAADSSRGSAPVRVVLSEKVARQVALGMRKERSNSSEERPKNNTPISLPSDDDLRLADPSDVFSNDGVRDLFSDAMGVGCSFTLVESMHVGDSPLTTTAGGSSNAPSVKSLVTSPASGTTPSSVPGVEIVVVRDTALTAKTSAPLLLGPTLASATSFASAGSFSKSSSGVNAPATTESSGTVGSPSTPTGLYGAVIGDKLVEDIGGTFKTATIDGVEVQGVAEVESAPAPYFAEDQAQNVLHQAAARAKKEKAQREQEASSAQRKGSNSSVVSAASGGIGSKRGSGAEPSPEGSGIGLVGTHIEVQPSPNTSPRSHPAAAPDKKRPSLVEMPGLLLQEPTRFGFNPDSPSLASSAANSRRGSTAANSDNELSPSKGPHSSADHDKRPPGKLGKARASVHAVNAVHELLPPKQAVVGEGDAKDAVVRGSISVDGSSSTVMGTTMAAADPELPTEAPPQHAGKSSNLGTPGDAQTSAGKGRTQRKKGDDAQTPETRSSNAKGHVPKPPAKKSATSPGARSVTPTTSTTMYQNVLPPAASAKVDRGDAVALVLPAPSIMIAHRAAIGRKLTKAQVIAPTEPKKAKAGAKGGVKFPYVQKPSVHTSIFSRKQRSVRAEVIAIDEKGVPHAVNTDELDTRTAEFLDRITPRQVASGYDGGRNSNGDKGGKSIIVIDEAVRQQYLSEVASTGEDAFHLDKLIPPTERASAMLRVYAPHDRHVLEHRQKAAEIADRKLIDNLTNSKSSKSTFALPIDDGAAVLDPLANAGTHVLSRALVPVESPGASRAASPTKRDPIGHAESRVRQYKDTKRNVDQKHSYGFLESIVCSQSKMVRSSQTVASATINGVIDTRYEPQTLREPSAPIDDPVAARPSALVRSKEPTIKEQHVLLQAGQSRGVYPTDIGPTAADVLRRNVALLEQEEKKRRFAARARRASESLALSTSSPSAPKSPDIIAPATSMGTPQAFTADVPEFFAPVVAAVATTKVVRVPPPSLGVPKPDVTLAETFLPERSPWIVKGGVPSGGSGSVVGQHRVLTEHNPSRPPGFTWQQNQKNPRAGRPRNVPTLATLERKAAASGPQSAREASSTDDALGKLDKETMPQTARTAAEQPQVPKPPAEEKDTAFYRNGGTLSKLTGEDSKVVSVWTRLENTSSKATLDASRRSAEDAKARYHEHQSELETAVMMTDVRGEPFADGARVVHGQQLAISRLPVGKYVSPRGQAKAQTT